MNSLPSDVLDRDVYVYVTDTQRNQCFTSNILLLVKLSVIPDWAWARH